MQLLKELQLTAEDVRRLTARMRPHRELCLIQAVKELSNSDTKDLIIPVLKASHPKWLNSTDLSYILLLKPTLIGNTLTAMLKAGYPIERRVNTDGRPQYRWLVKEDENNE